MNSRYFKWLKSGLLGSLVLLGFNACTDDHFDISSTTPKESLWTQIASNPELDSLRQILEKTTFTVDEYSKSESTLTYAQLLAGSQTFTVWAPKDGTYNASHWLAILNEKGGNYEVEKQFVRNHVARYNFDGINGSDTIEVTMLNSKIINFCLLDNTFKKIPVQQTIQASNGTLHLLNQEVPFASSLYEAIEFTPGLDSLYAYLHEDDTLMFLKWASTPGATVDGEIQYVDSVFSISNKVIGSLNSWKDEDSVMLGIFPSNDAWPEVISKVSKYFKYKKQYPYKQNGSKRILYNKFDTDSMADLRCKWVVLGNVINSLGKQPGYNEKESDLEYFKNWIANADSLVRGGHTSLSNPNLHQPYLSTLFDGQEPREVSNGFIYKVDHYNYLPSKSWHTTIRVEAESTYWQNVNDFSSAEKDGESQYYGTSVYLTSLNRNDSVQGIVSNNSFRYFNGSSSASQPTISYKMPDIQSGKYDIYVVMVPLNINKKNQPIAETKRNRFQCDLTYDYNDRTGKEIVEHAKDPNNPRSKYFETRAGVVDTILLFKDFEFPYAFVGAEPSYPMISMKSVVRTGIERKNFDPALYVDCFLFVGKDD